MRITRKIEIDAGHRVPGHKNAEGKPGACSSPHGHRYVIEATVDGTVPADGMVLDLGIVKQVMMDTIHRKADHAMLVWAGDDELFYALDGHDWKVCVLDDPPTAENLAKYVETYLGTLKPGGVNRHLVTAFGSKVIPHAVRVVKNDGSREVVAEWKAPMFMALDGIM